MGLPLLMILKAANEPHRHLYSADFGKQHRHHFTSAMQHQRLEQNSGKGTGGSCTGSTPMSLCALKKFGPTSPHHYVLEMKPRMYWCCDINLGFTREM